MVDTNYVKTWAGMLKIGQFICLLIAFSSLAHFSNESENNGGFKFFLFVTITSWLIVMVLFGLFASQIYERIPLNWTLAMIIYSAIEAFLLLVASSVVADKARKLRRGVISIHKKFEDKCYVYDKDHVSCSNVEAALVFGFILVALFLADMAFYTMKYRVPTESGFIQDQEAGTHDTNPSNVEQIP